MSIYPSFVDDNDPSVIYSGSGWVLVTQDGQWTGTMHSTSVTGSWARFRFTGSRVAVICTIPTGDGQLSQATFKIDDGNDQYAAHRTTPPVQWQTTFWDSGPLPMGSHLLTITNAGNEAYFRMDRIDFDPTDSNAPATTSNTPSQGTVTVVQPPNTSSSPSGTTAISSNTGSSSVNSTGSSITSTNTQSLPSTSVASTTNTPATTGTSAPGTQNDALASSSSSPPLAGILAGVFAGLFVILLGVVIVYFLRRRRRKRIAKAKEELYAAPFPPTSTSRLDPSFRSPITDVASDTGSVSDGALSFPREKTFVPPPRSIYHEGASTSLSMYTDVPASQSATSESREQDLHPKIQAIMRENGQSGSRLVAHNPTEAPDSRRETLDPYRDFPPPPAYSGPGSSAG